MDVKQKVGNMNQKSVFSQLRDIHNSILKQPVLGDYAGKQTELEKILFSPHFMCGGQNSRVPTSEQLLWLTVWRAGFELSEYFKNIAEWRLKHLYDVLLYWESLEKKEDFGLQSLKDKASIPTDDLVLLNWCCRSHHVVAFQKRYLTSDNKYIVYETQRVYVAMLKNLRLESAIEHIASQLGTTSTETLGTVYSYTEVCRDLLSRHNSHARSFFDHIRQSLLNYVSVLFQNRSHPEYYSSLYQLILIQIKIVKLITLYQHEAAAKYIMLVLSTHGPKLVDLLFDCAIQDGFIWVKTCRMWFRILCLIGLKGFQSRKGLLGQYALSIVDKVFKFGIFLLYPDDVRAEQKSRPKFGFTGSSLTDTSGCNNSKTIRLAEGCLLCLKACECLTSKSGEGKESKTSQKSYTVLHNLDVFMQENVPSISSMPYCWLPEVFGEQDDLWIEALLMLINIAPSATNNTSISFSHHHYFRQFITYTGNDHSILVDLLTSPETDFLAYFIKYLKYSLTTWEEFVEEYAHCVEAHEVANKGTRELNSDTENKNDEDIAFVEAHEVANKGARELDSDTENENDEDIAFVEGHEVANKGARELDSDSENKNDEDIAFLEAHEVANKGARELDSDNENKNDEDIAFVEAHEVASKGPRELDSDTENKNDEDIAFTGLDDCVIIEEDNKDQKHMLETVSVEEVGNEIQCYEIVDSAQSARTMHQQLDISGKRPGPVLHDSICKKRKEDKHSIKEENLNSDNYDNRVNRIDVADCLEETGSDCCDMESIDEMLESVEFVVKEPSAEAIIYESVETELEDCEFSVMQTLEDTSEINGAKPSAKSKEMHTDEEQSQVADTALVKTIDQFRGNISKLTSAMSNKDSNTKDISNRKQGQAFELNVCKNGKHSEPVSSRAIEKEKEQRPSDKANNSKIKKLSVNSEIGAKAVSLTKACNQPVASENKGEEKVITNEEIDYEFGTLEFVEEVKSNDTLRLEDAQNNSHTVVVTEGECSAVLDINNIDLNIKSVESIAHGNAEINASNIQKKRLSSDLLMSSDRKLYQVSLENGVSESEKGKHECSAAQLRQVKFKKDNASTSKSEKFGGKCHPPSHLKAAKSEIIEDSEIEIELETIEFVEETSQDCMPYKSNCQNQNQTANSKTISRIDLSDLHVDNSVEKRTTDCENDVIHKIEELPETSSACEGLEDYIMSDEDEEMILHGEEEDELASEISLPETEKSGEVVKKTEFLDDIMGVLIRVRIKLEKLRTAEILQYNPQSLLRLLCAIESKYESQ